MPTFFRVTEIPTRLFASVSAPAASGACAMTRDVRTRRSLFPRLHLSLASYARPSRDTRLPERWSRSSWRRQHANKAVVHQRRTGERVNKQSKETERRFRQEGEPILLHHASTMDRNTSLPNGANGRGVQYFRHGRGTWRHIFRTCRTESHLILARRQVDR